MVADPVQVILGYISYYLNLLKDAASSLKDTLLNMNLSETLGKLSPQSLGVVGRKPAIQHNASYVDRLRENLQLHKQRYITILTIGIGLGVVLIAKNYDVLKMKHRNKKRRRAPKLPNGARRDLILVIGSPTEPLTRLIALDFEKRGFLVYLTILDEKDIRYIESNPITEGINYLNLNTPNEFETSLSKFSGLFNTPVVPFPGAEAHKLRLAAVIFAPSLHFPIGPIENISITSWLRINEKIMNILKLFSSGLPGLIRAQRSKTIAIYANIISSLDLPYHAPESWYQNSLKSIFSTLTKEFYRQGLSVTQVRLGNLNISTNGVRQGSKLANIVNTEVRNWDGDMISLYGDSFSKSEFRTNPTNSSVRRTKLKELHHLLFDLISNKNLNPSICYCGTGARSYDIVSYLVPQFILNWLLA